MEIKYNNIFSQMLKIFPHSVQVKKDFTNPNLFAESRDRPTGAQWIYVAELWESAKIADPWWFVSPLRE